MERGDTAGWEREEKRIAWLLGELPTLGMHPNSCSVKQNKEEQISARIYWCNIFKKHLKQGTTLTSTVNVLHVSGSAQNLLAGMFVARGYMQSRVSGIRL